MLLWLKLVTIKLRQCVANKTTHENRTDERFQVQSLHITMLKMTIEWMDCNWILKSTVNGVSMISTWCSERNMHIVQDSDAGGMRFETTVKRVRLFAWEKSLLRLQSKKMTQRNYLSAMKRFFCIFSCIELRFKSISWWIFFHNFGSDVISEPTEIDAERKYSSLMRDKKMSKQTKTENKTEKIQKEEEERMKKNLLAP